MQNIQSIIQAIKVYETVIIHRHMRPDPDAYGSQAGLKQMITQSFPEKHVYITGEEDPSLSFLADMDDIPDETYQNALVIVCDTANTERISDERFHYGRQLIKIDHHPEVDAYGDVAWVDTSASSTSEMIYDLYLLGKNQGFKLNDEAARLLYAGIVGDTGRFLFPNSTKKTFQHAAELVAYNFDRSSLYDGIYRMKDNMARLRGYILQNFEQTESGMSTVVLTKELLESYGVSPMETGQLVGVLGDIEGMKAWVFFIEEDELIRVRLRSKGPVINDIAAKYNGGGHPMAAGASIGTWAEMKEVVRDLDSVCMAYEN
ncbi:bifunctional oligoribonuclease/PAP phosphatase NrnA [Lentibacillus cibarius]|uniref:Bifunctional oligoribonuclease/PAP phosphatase NrnA n=1 Tax=Lentibacillus cibarius TaxID=2583219 RepID=A0A549YM40_9BACI|nr:bifunctional oligoribonuclease/PAP phosphatase NrnA [Lentibacillus cibarius]TRM12943.1 bifunctional oligoribonuclease/PAP phosphatase NrnA [Lentibacillus cibarius]